MKHAFLVVKSQALTKKTLKPAVEGSTTLIRDLGFPRNCSSMDVKERQAGTRFIDMKQPVSYGARYVFDRTPDAGVGVARSRGTIPVGKGRLYV